MPISVLVVSIKRHDQENATPGKPGVVALNRKGHYTTMKYLITGTLVNGSRFRKECGTNLNYALAHNVYRGTLWQIKDGKRTRIHRWWN
jgi:hypothetical protein